MDTISNEQITLPASLLELAYKVQAQDNSKHITSHPQYQVRTKELVYGEFEDEEGFIWLDKSACEPASQGTANLMEARYRKDGTDETENFRRCGYKKIDVTVQTFFSEDNARAWIKRQGHNYDDLFLYVESGCYNYEWQAVRDFLLSLPTTPPAPGIVALATPSHGGNTRNVLNSDPADTCAAGDSSCIGCGDCAGPSGVTQ